METIAGHCGKCGAPYFVPGVWFGVVPPTPRPICSCWNIGKSAWITIDEVGKITDFKPVENSEDHDNSDHRPA